MVTSQNTPSWWIWAVTKGVEDYSWRVVLVTGGGAQWSRYWAPSLLTYSWSHSQHQRGDTAMWWCFVCASLVTAMAEWPFKTRGTFQAPTHSFIPLCMGKEKHMGRLKLNGLPLNPSTSLNQPAYKSYIPSAQLLDRPPLSNSASNTVSTDTLLYRSMWRGKLVRQAALSAILAKRSGELQLEKPGKLQAVSFTDGSCNNSETRPGYNQGGSFHLGCLDSLHTVTATAYCC